MKRQTPVACEEMREPYLYARHYWFAGIKETSPQGLDYALCVPAALAHGILRHHPTIPSHPLVLRTFNSHTPPILRLGACSSITSVSEGRGVLLRARSQLAALPSGAVGGLAPLPKPPIPTFARGSTGTFIPGAAIIPAPLDRIQGSR